MDGDIAKLGFQVPTTPLENAVNWLKKLAPAAKSAEDATTKLSKNSTAGFNLLGKSADTSTSALRKLGIQIGLTVAAGAGLVSMITTANSLNKALGQVSTLLPNATASMGAIEASTHAMAQMFGSDATQQANSYYQILSAGVTDVAEATDILTASNKLAIGGAAELSSTTLGLTSIMNSYAGKVKSVSEVSDTLFAAAAAGSTNIEELSSSLGQITPIASALNVNFQELVGTVAALTNGGLTTSEAIDGLRAILTSVAKPSGEAVKLSKAIGLQFNTTALAAKGLTGFIEDVVKKTGGSSDAFGILFANTRALTTSMALANQMGSKLNGVLDQVKNNAGSTDAAFNKMSATLSQRGAVAMSKIADVGTQVGEKLLEGAIPAVEALADTVSDPKFINGAIAFGTVIVKTINAITEVATAGIKALGDFANLVNAAIAAHTPQAGGGNNAAQNSVLSQIETVQTLIKQHNDPNDYWNYNADKVDYFTGRLKVLQNELAIVNAQTGNGKGWAPLMSMGSGVGLDRADHASAIATAGPASAMSSGTGDLKQPAGLEALIAQLQAGTLGQHKGLDPYTKLTLGAQQYIGTQKQMVTALGQSALATSIMQHQQDLLNQAANDNVKLTPVQTKYIGQLAVQMAEAEQQQTQLTAAFNLGKSVVSGFISDVTSGLGQGTNAWSVFESAGLNALKSIGNAIAQNAGSNIWSTLFNSATSSGGNGGWSALMGGGSSGGGGLFSWLGKLLTPSAHGNSYQGNAGLSSYTNQIVNKPTMFAKGGMGLMGENNGQSEAIVPLKRNSSGDLGVAMSGGSAGGGDVHYHDERQYSIDARGAQIGVAEQIDTMLKRYDNNLPDRLQQIRNDPRKRKAG